MSRATARHSRHKYYNYPSVYHKIYIHIMNYIYAIYVKEKGVRINIQSR